MAEATNGNVIHLSKTARLPYEETKGAGSGPPENTGQTDDSHSDDYIPEEGKNVIYTIVLIFKILIWSELVISLINLNTKRPK